MPGKLEIRSGRAAWLRTLVGVLPATLVVAGCGAEPDATDGPAETRFTIGGERPATLALPAERSGRSLPLVIVLHGFTANADWIDRYFGISGRIDSDGIAVVLPNGTLNQEDQRFWNATDFCCDFYGSGVNDVAYLNRLASEAAEHVQIDGIHLVGLSNGGFMSYRMACESMPGLRTVVSVAGTTFHDPLRCEGARPISVLHVHGTSDGTILYGGGARSGGEVRYPGAEETVERWAARAGCDIGAAESLPRMDLVANIPAEETAARSYRSGCQDGLRVELWTIEDGPHVPAFEASDFGARIVAWLLATPD